MLLWREAPILGALLEVDMSIMIKCTPLWREAHFQAKRVDVQMSFGVAGVRDSAPSQQCTKRESFVALSKAFCILEHQIVRFAKMFCVTGAAFRMAWPHFFLAGAIL